MNAEIPATRYFIDQVSLVKQEDPTGVSISEDVTICIGETQRFQLLVQILILGQRKMNQQQFSGLPKR